MKSVEFIVDSLYNVIPKGTSLSFPFIIKGSERGRIALFTYSKEEMDNFCSATLENVYVIDCETLDADEYPANELTDDASVTVAQPEEELREDVKELEREYLLLIDAHNSGEDLDQDRYSTLLSELEYTELLPIYRMLGADFI